MGWSKLQMKNKRMKVKESRLTPMKKNSNFASLLFPVGKKSPAATFANARERCGTAGRAEGPHLQILELTNPPSFPHRPLVYSQLLSRSTCSDARLKFALS